MRSLLTVILALVTQLLFAQSTSLLDTIDRQFLKISCPKALAQIDKECPAFTFKDGNQIINNNDLKGKVVFINFWFEGCHPCIAEVEALNELYEKLRDNKDFLFVSISTDDKKIIARVKEKYAIKYPVISSTHTDCQQLNFNCGFPTSIIVDKNGMIKFFHNGGSIEKDIANEYILKSVLPKIESLL